MTETVGTQGKQTADDPETLDTQEELTVEGQASKLRDAIARELGNLADELLGRPAFGSEDWLDIHKALNRDKTAESEWRREWHLTKITISREAKIDPTGDVLNARYHGATWENIADACGITRQRAHERWAKLYNSIYPKG
jgi:hypothetical protein